jgi:hypothetical protein
MIGSYGETVESGKRLSARIELWECAGFFVILHGESHIQYSNQTGGTRCAHPVVEGYLIPMDRYCNPDTGEDIFEGLREITLDWWGEGMHKCLDHDGLIPRLRRLVEALRPTGWDFANGLWCELDLERLRTEKCGEAWLPVNTPMGQGWLTWENSD